LIVLHFNTIRGKGERSAPKMARRSPTSTTTAGPTSMMVRRLTLVSGGPETAFEEVGTA
jgi:hypothetical protein